MALINCPLCGKQISDRAAKCPHCGHVLHDKDRQNRASEKSSKEKDIVVPKHFGRNLLIFALICIAGFYGYFLYIKQTMRTNPSSYIQTDTLSVESDSIISREVEEEEPEETTQRIEVDSVETDDFEETSEPTTPEKQAGNETKEQRTTSADSSSLSKSKPKLYVPE